MGYDRIVYIRYHFSCGLDRKDACWLSFTPLTGFKLSQFSHLVMSAGRPQFERSAGCLGLALRWPQSRRRRMEMVDSHCVKDAAHQKAIEAKAQRASAVYFPQVFL